MHNRGGVQPQPQRQRRRPDCRAQPVCDRCSLRKSKCNSKHPCNTCQELNVECHFATRTLRGAKNGIPGRPPTPTDCDGEVPTPAILAALGHLEPATGDIGDMQLPKQGTTSTSLLSEKSDHLKRREGPATFGLDVRATKRPRSEAPHGVPPQQKLPPTPGTTPSSTQSIITSPITNNQFRTPTSATTNASIDCERPRSADMCGQFEDIVGAVPPPRQRPYQPLPQPLPAQAAAGDDNFFDFNRYEQERTTQYQHPIPTHTFSSLSTAIGDTNQSITDSQPWNADTAPYSHDPGLELDTSGFLALGW